MVRRSKEQQELEGHWVSESGRSTQASLSLSRVIRLRPHDEMKVEPR